MHVHIVADGDTLKQITQLDKDTVLITLEGILFNTVLCYNKYTYIFCLNFIAHICTYM